ncbi:GNAT family N-acetyltransferase [Lysobacter enzymogenes]|uniref:GNAT family N-acetyltransferase n=1 Tax=Lysobacter enzymogenes TaxID=69 RepID=UPI001A973123|nr:GNAT family N-acetyltransferase [Lysobacter enzymogenes]QQP98509.1 GNAT family N-acetyltransferase [Lysobacter enzymogenes]
MLDLDSAQWTQALGEGLGAQLTRLRDGGTVACFKAGPFRVAYPDFLIGSSAVLDAQALDERVAAAAGLRADLIRLQAAQAPVDARVQAVHSIGSIAIGRLADWQERSWEKARRAGNRAPRSPLRLRPGRAEDGAQIDRLYQATLRRHGGSIRYNRRYFELIAPAAAIVAELDGTICGFVCAGFQRGRACYMHGAHDPEARAHYPSDLLFLEMLRRAREAGMQRFDFLPSPPGQSSLSAYKRAWGGSDEALTVSDLALRPLRAKGFSIALRLSKAVDSFRRG